MMPRSWIRMLFASPARRKVPQRSCLALVAMESRDCPATFTVINTAGDTSIGSLRWAVLQANALEGDDTVVFDSSFNTPQTIALAGWSVQPDEPYALTKIIGPGSKLLTVSGAGNSRVFTIAPGCEVEISGMTLANGLAYLTDGGGLSNKGFTKLTDCTFTGNGAAYGRGGGNIWNDNFSTLDLINCTIRDNYYSQSSTRNGGGLLNDGTVTMKGCTFSGNTSFSDGAGVFNSSTGKLTMTDCAVNDNTGSLAFGGGVANQGAAVLTNCTFSGNYSSFGAVGNSSTGTLTMNFCTVSNSIAGGGIENKGTVTLNSCTISNNIGNGVRNSGTASLFNSAISGNSAQGDGGGLVSGAGPVTMTNCTITNNTASSGDGGGLLITGPSNSTLTNCTISSNTASGKGGGLYATITVKLLNVIIANNSAISGYDVSGTITSQGKNLISRTDGSSGFGVNDLTGTNSSPLNAVLGPLGNYGGSTKTIALLPGSPAINGGITQSGSDQRGKGRVGATDIGAFESQGFSLTPVSGSTPQSTPAPDGAFANPLALTVTAINAVEPIIGGIVRFTAPTSGASAVLSASSVTLSSSPATVSVTATGNGTAGSYVVTATAATGVTASFSLLNLGLPATYVVNTTSDSVNPGPGLLSLPQAISLAGSDAAVSTIAFDPTVFATPQTITRTGTGSLPVWLELRDTFAQDTIIGPAAGVTIHGGGLGPVLQIVANVTASATGLTITGGSANNATAAGVALLSTAVFTMTNSTITNNNGTGVLAAMDSATSTKSTLYMTNCTISNNTSTGNASGIRVPGIAVLTNCTISGNTGNFHGGISTAGNTTLINCTISSNTGTSGAGGIYVIGTMTMTNCTVNNNVGTTTGGILILATASGIIGGTLAMTNCTVSGNSVSVNTATTTAGGISAGGTLTMTNCTITGNAGSAGTGGIRGGGTLLNSIVAGNTGTTAADVLSNFVSAAVVSSGGSGYTSTPTVTISGGGGTGATAHATMGSGYITVTLDTGGSGYTSTPTIAISGGGGSGANYTARVALITSLGNNLIGTIGNSLGWIASDRTGTDASPLDPLLGTLANNGGPVQTMALLTGSPAINAGSNSVIQTTDARGLARNFDGVDVGAFELQPGSVSKITLSTPTVSDANVGPDGFSVTAAFNMPMNTAVQPSIAFPAEVPAGSVTFTSGTWLDNATWLAKFQVADLGTSLSDIDMQISGARDSAANLIQHTYIAIDAVQVDTQNAVIASISSTTPDGTYTAGQTVNITLNFSEPVTLSGTLNVTLDTGAVVNFASQTGTSLSGTYTVGAGQSSSDLNVAALALTSGSTLLDAAGNASVLALPTSNLANYKSISIGGATVTGFTVNDGIAQRSRLTKIVVNFSGTVDVATIAGGITLTRGDGTIVNAANGLVVTPAAGPATSLTLSFANTSDPGIEYGSLADGYWRLAIPSLSYQSMLNDSAFRRLYGDVNGDGTVDGASDFAAFGNVFGVTVANSPFDFNNDGTIDGSTDFAQFGARFGITI